MNVLLIAEQRVKLEPQTTRSPCYLMITQGKSDHRVV